MAFLPKPPGASAGPLHHGVPDAPAGDSAGAARGDGSRAPVRAASHPQRVLDLLPAPQPSFDNFIVGDNAELVDLLRGDAVSAQSRFVYLWGVPGSGRSHLLHAATVAGAGLATGAPAASAAPAFGAGRFMDLREPAAPLGIELLTDAQGLAVTRLALDNVDALDAGGEQRLFNLYNTLRQEYPMCSLLVSGPRPPAALALRADLVTRLSWGLTYQVHPLTETQKAAAMDAHAQARGASIGADVLEWLLYTMPRDLPTLLAAVDALDQYSLAAKRPLTLPLAREWLRSPG
jgi:DnaA family protein